MVSNKAGGFVLHGGFAGVLTHLIAGTGSGIKQVMRGLTGFLARAPGVRFAGLILIGGLIAWRIIFIGTDRKSVV